MRQPQFSEFILAFMLGYGYGQAMNTKKTDCYSRIAKNKKTVTGCSTEPILCLEYSQSP